MFAWLKSIFANKVSVCTCELERQFNDIRVNHEGVPNYGDAVEFMNRSPTHHRWYVTHTRVMNYPPTPPKKRG